jgi:hypothetical protein
MPRYHEHIHLPDDFDPLQFLKTVFFDVVRDFSAALQDDLAEQLALQSSLFTLLAAEFAEKSSDTAALAEKLRMLHE